MEQIASERAQVGGVSGARHVGYRADGRHVCCENVLAPPSGGGRGGLSGLESHLVAEVL
jgi:hypothetical protein